MTSKGLLPFPRTCIVPSSVSFKSFLLSDFIDFVHVQGLYRVSLEGPGWNSFRNRYREGEWLGYRCSCCIWFRLSGFRGGDLILWWYRFGVVDLIIWWFGDDRGGHLGWITGLSMRFCWLRWFDRRQRRLWGHLFSPTSVREIGVIVVDVGWVLVYIYYKAPFR